MVTGTNISKSFGNQVVLDDLNFNLKKGEIVGLLGRNGAGKSTLLKIISGINKADSGAINLDGLKVGYLSERNPLYPHMYVREYLTWIKNLKGIKVQNRIQWAIDNVGLQEVVTKKVGQLSKGFKQRLGLAATMMSDPDIVILDEPINGLDPLQIEAYRNFIKSIAADKYIILSSHLLQEIEALCDHVLLIDEGKIEEKEISSKRTDSHYELVLKVDGSMGASALENLENVNKVILKKEGVFSITCIDSTRLRADIFDICVDNEVKILEFRKSDNSLKDIFIK